MGYYETVCYDIRETEEDLRELVAKSIRKVTDLRPMVYDWGKNWDPFPELKKASTIEGVGYIWCIHHQGRGSAVYETIYANGVAINAKAIDSRRPELKEVYEVAERVRAKALEDSL